MTRTSPYPVEHRREIKIARLRQLLAETRASDYDAYITLRAQISVFDLIEIEGEEMSDALTKRGNFKLEEITLSGEG